MRVLVLRPDVWFLQPADAWGINDTAAVNYPHWECNGAGECHDQPLVQGLASDAFWLFRPHALAPFAASPSGASKVVHGLGRVQLEATPEGPIPKTIVDVALREHLRQHQHVAASPLNDLNATWHVLLRPGCCESTRPKDLMWTPLYSLGPRCCYAKPAASAANESADDLPRCIGRKEAVKLFKRSPSAPPCVTLALTLAFARFFGLTPTLTPPPSPLTPHPSPLTPNPHPRPSPSPNLKEAGLDRKESWDPFEDRPARAGAPGPRDGTIRPPTASVTPRVPRF